MGQWEWGSAYRHDFATLAEDALLGTHVHGGAVQAATGLFDKAHDKEDARVGGDALQLLPRAVTSDLRAVRGGGILAGELPVHPAWSGAGTAVTNGVTQVDGALKVACIFIVALGRAAADDGTEAAAARVPADEGLGQKEDVRAARGGSVGEGRDELEGGGGGGLGSR